MKMIQILYLSTSCSPEKYKEVYEIRTVKAIEPQQKFNALLIKGLSENPGVMVTAISALPVSASTCPAKRFDYEEEKKSETLEYRYIPFRNGKITRIIDTILNTKKLVAKWVEETNGEDRFIIVDALSVFMVYDCFGIADKKRIPIIGIVTDLPELSTSMKARSENWLRKYSTFVFQKVISKTFSKYNAYITLTESLNDVVNSNRVKSYIIIEGSIDSDIKYNHNRNTKRTVVYAGGVYAKYGVKNLVEAFSLLETDAELHIYGDGTYANDIIVISQKHCNIKYKGIVSLEEIVSIEEEACLLVNPRPGDEEFSKYSFPSKTMEYMASGTPLLSTRLPGIPSEYFNYLYSIEDESVEGIKNVLGSLLKLDSKLLAEKGRLAFDFVKANKTALKQGESIIKFLKTL